MKVKHPNLNFIAVVVIFVLVIVIGLLTLNKPDLKYKLSLDETLGQLMLNEEEMHPRDLADILKTEDQDHVVIDLRNPYEFMKGHIAGAVNIPTNSLLDKENTKLFDNLSADSVTVVLYGKDQLEANGPWMILKQLGYNNIRILLGGYQYFTGMPLDARDMPETPEYLVEEPVYDYYGIMEELGSISVEDRHEAEQPEVIMPARKKKKSAVEGGC